MLGTAQRTAQRACRREAERPAKPAAKAGKSAATAGNPIAKAGKALSGLAARAGRSRLDRLAGRPVFKPRKRPLRMPSGKQIAREYWSEITRVALRPLFDLIRERLVSQLPALEAKARAELGLDAARADIVDDVERVMETVGLAYTEAVPPSAMRELAQRRGTQVSELNSRALGREFKRALGLDVLAEDPALDARMNEFSAENVRLITKMVNEHKARIGGIVTNGLAKGRTATALARDIEKAAGIPRRRAQLIARDQTATLQGRINRARQRANGVTHFIWRTAGDDRVRDEHEGLEGRKFSWATGAPGEGFPGDPINCRCTAEPVLE